VPRLTTDQWAAIRIEWEGEPLASFLGLAEKYGVQASSISRQAAKNGWMKRGVLKNINEAAQRIADARTDADGNAKQTQRQGTAADLAFRNESEDLRAEVLTRHRQEWAELRIFRKVSLKEMKTAHDNGNKEAWMKAKIAADTALAQLRALAIQQDGERKAWGLDLSAAEDIVITNPRSFDGS
jgi:hypothetical protein